ncbi:MAG: FAD-dependent oxidoreductase [Roseobacter sp.]
MGIVGGGFAGTWTAMSAAATRAQQNTRDIEITLISASESLCIRPRLYEEISEDMLAPLRPLMNEIEVDFSHAPVEKIVNTTVHTSEGAFEFDNVILCAGSHLAMPDVAGAFELGFSIDTYEEAKRLNTHVNSLNFGLDQQACLVVVGASFTGIELVSGLRKRLGNAARLILVDRSDEPGETLGRNVTPHVRNALRDLNIEIHANVGVDMVDQSGVVLTNGHRIETSTVVFATGLTASKLTRNITSSDLIEADGRVEVDAMLRVPGRPNIFAAGDVARAKTDPEHDTLMSCQHAMPMGVAAGRNAVLACLDLALRPYEQPFYATCLDLGDAGAVFTQGWDRKVEKIGSEGAEM